MKRILYLDKDFMESYIAQRREGLPTAHTLTNASQNMDLQAVSQPNMSHKISGSAKGSFAIAGVEAAYEHSIQTKSQQNVALASDGITEAVTYTPHDNLLDAVIEDSGADQNQEAAVGSFVLIDGAKPILYDIRDILERLDEKAIEFIAVKIAEDHIMKLPNPNAKQVDMEKKRIIREQANMLRDARTALEMTCHFAQFDVCVAIGDVIVPLKRNCMRTTSRDMVFKYDSGLHVFGQVTRIQSKAEKASDQNPVEIINAIFNGMWPQALQRMQILPEDGYRIVDPMAVYFA